jgi:thiol-disulfide isomerase/thioredoxin
VLPAAQLAGRPVVVEFWASWCPFCKKQNPAIEKLHRDGGERLRVLTFSIDKSEQVARDYLQQHGYTFPAAMAGAQSDAWFGPRRGLPVVHVVDAAGRVVFTERGEMFEEDVAALMRFARSG